jgi:hypothetical protein
MLIQQALEVLLKNRTSFVIATGFPPFAARTGSWWCKTTISRKPHARGADGDPRRS